MLPVAAIYGANASGKSNVLSALGFMRDAVLDSHNAWPPEAGVPREAFAWANKGGDPSLFEVTFLHDEVRYQYGFLLDQARVQEEWLFAWPKGRRQTWLERDGDDFAFGEHLRGENRVVEKVTRKNALFLSTAAQHGHEQLTAVHGWFRRLQTVRVLGYTLGSAFAAAAGIRALIRMLKTPEATMGLSTRGQDGASRLRDLMRAADLGIADFRVVEDPNGRRELGGGGRRIEMLHDVGEADAWLPLDQESAGTRALFELGPAVIGALASGSPLVIDELESGLHPLVALQLVGLFNSPKTNPRNAQLLFTTHDTNLLGTTLGDPQLRRDQIWLTEKDPSGATTLYPLTDYKPRKAENLERGYLQGRYGAIPFLGALEGLGE